MRVAVTFCDETENEGRYHERSYTFFRGGEAESLPHLIEFKTPALFNQIATPSKWLWSRL